MSRDGGNSLEEPTVKGWREFDGEAYCQGIERVVRGGYCRGMEGTCWRGHLVVEKSANLYKGIGV